MRRLALACLLAATGLAAGCDRVPIAPVRTDLLVTSPDLSVVQFDADLELTLAPDGPTRPLTLRIRDKEVDFDSTAGVFRYSRQLVRGLNVYPVSITDEDGETAFDTLFAVYLPAERQPLVSADAGTARAGAAVTTLVSGQSAVTGGVGASGAALATASVLREAGPQILSNEFALRTARAGHSATPLFGGTLLLGGATRLVPGSRADFVTQAEWLNGDGASQAVPVVDGEGTEPRAGHVAQVVASDGETYVYVLGGQVPQGAGVGVSQTVDIYRVLGDPLRLERLTPEGGANGFATLSGPLLVRTGARSATAFGLSGDGDTAVRLGWSLPGVGTFPFSLDRATGATLRTPRAGAAAVDIGGGLTLIVGGRDASGDPVGTFEVYAGSFDRTFRFPEAFQLAVPRSGHTATILSGTRIVVSGGRPANGSVLVSYEAFQF